MYNTIPTLLAKVYYIDKETETLSESGVKVKEITEDFKVVAEVTHLTEFILATQVCGKKVLLEFLHFDNIKLLNY